MKSKQIIDYLADQGIDVNPTTPKPSFFDPQSEVDGERYPSLPFAVRSDEKLSLEGKHAESMSLASMYAVSCLGVNEGDKILDTCAAPGMKGLYLNSLHNIDYYCNDLSSDRLARLRRIFEKHGIEPIAITKFDAKYIDRAYDTEFFDRIIIDAPCSGEGVALGGDTKALDAWSPAKVKRLQQLQIKIVKSAWTLLKPGGRLVYATCTLNKNENERVIKKALGITLAVTQDTLDPQAPRALMTDTAVRLLPSFNSIGFFVACIDKVDIHNADSEEVWQ